MKLNFFHLLTSLFFLFSLTITAQESGRIANTTNANALNGATSISQSGGLTTSVPLTSANSRSLSLPVSLDYSAGITVDQKASDVGLGWDMTIGSIKRDYGAFEPDYTATSGEMEFASGADFLSNSSESFSVNTENADKIFGYNTVEENAQQSPMNPDDYIVSLPMFSGTFWNSGVTGGDHEFVFNDINNWRIEFEKEVFEVPQEVSRINEYNSWLFHQNGGVGEIFNRSYANAICVPPYVHNREFESIVTAEDYGNNAIAGSDFNVDENAVVKYEDFGKFILTAPDGTRYIFGRALRGQKYLLNEDPFWSTVDNPENYSSNDVKGEFWKMDFVSEWLLTEILSYDYYDSNNNGIADDNDAGDWIRVNYTNPLQNEEVLSAQGTEIVKASRHREWLNYTQTDKASSVMKEKAYVTSIITPIQQLDFETSERIEVDHDYFDKPFNFNQDTREYPYEDLPYGSENGSATDFDVEYKNELQKYDKIKVIERIRDERNYPGRNKVLQTIELHYADKGSSEELAVSNYLIRNNNNEEALSDYSGGNQFSDGKFSPTDDRESIDFDVRDYYKEQGRGKTTLLGVSIYAGNDANSNEKITYDFEYGYNPSFSEIHKRYIVNQVFSPMVRQSIGAARPHEIWPQIKWHNSLESNDYSMRYVEEVRSILPMSRTISYCLESPDQVDDIFNESEGFPALNAFSEYPIETQFSSLSNMLGLYYPSEQNIGNPDADHTLTAWSLTKIAKNDGYSETFEYEGDDILSLEDATEFDLRPIDVPVIKDYNELAKRRSIDQDAMTKQYSDGDGSLKELYGEYTLPDNIPLQGIRLKSKTISDGINPDQQINYEYEGIHYTGLPAVFWRNYINGFSSFLSLENRIHMNERCNYSSYYTNYGQGSWFGTDYSTYMSTTFTNYRVHNNVKGRKYYEQMKTVYPNGSSSISTYGTYKYYSNGEFVEWRHDNNQQDLVAIKGFDEGFISSKVYCFVEEDYGYATPVLYKTELFETGQTVPYQVEEFDYNINSELHRNEMIASELIAHPGNHYTTYAKITQGNTIFDPIYQTFNLISGISPEQLLTNSCGTSPGQPVLIQTKNLDYPRLDSNDAWEAQLNGSVQVTSSPWVVNSDVILKNSHTRNLTSQKTTKDGITSEVQYEYNDRNQLFRTTNYGSEYIQNGELHQDIVISETKHGYEIYGEEFLSRNMISDVVGTYSYADSPLNSNILSASAIQWSFNENVPRPLTAYSYRGDIDDTSGKIIDFQPFDYQNDQNSPNWVELNYNNEFNSFGQSVFSQSKRTFNRNVTGYGSGSIKASFSYGKEWFDATYTGFEDMPFDAGELNFDDFSDSEHWFNHYPVTQAEEYYEESLKFSFHEDDLPAEALCEGSYVYEQFSNGGAYTVRLIDNYDDYYGQGDRVEFYVTLEDELGNEYEQILGEYTIDYIIPIEGWEKPAYWTDEFTNPEDLAFYQEFLNHDHILCLEEQPAGTGYPWIYGAAKMRKVVPVSERKSLPTEIDSRSGEYCYDLGYRQNYEEVSEKTPVRPIAIEPSGNIDCIEEAENDRNFGYRSADDCDIEYTVSFWLKERPMYTQADVVSRQAVREQEGILSPTIGNNDLKLVFEVWDNTYSNRLEYGEYYIEDLHDAWTFYEVNFPVEKAFNSDRKLIVYIQNNMIQGTLPADRKILLVDDLLIYPTGAKYAYQSQDNFGNPTDFTDMNNNSIVNLYDSWGRLKESRNAIGETVLQNNYFRSQEIGRPSFAQTRTYLNGSQFSDSRTLIDPKGNVIQSIRTEPGKDTKTIAVTSVYDEMGWIERQYKPFAKVGVHFTVPFEEDFEDKLIEQYGSNNAYTKSVFKNRVHPEVTETVLPRQDSESTISAFVDQLANESSVVVGDRVYGPGELVKITTIDPLGATTIAYSDKFGRTLLTETPLGHSYTIQTQGEIQWDEGSEYETAQSIVVYDQAGNVIRTTDPMGLSTTFTYNSFKELLMEDHPDKGITRNKYNRWGELRFTQDSEEAARIDNNEFADLFSYNKYDVWGRAIESGLVKIPTGQSVVFTDETSINDQDYPNDNSTHEVHAKLVYDGSRSTNSANSLIEQIALADHELEGGIYVAQSEDVTRFEYDKNGRVVYQYLSFEELEGEYVYENHYNRLGGVTETVFTHPLNAEYNYKWVYTYDDLGRPLQSSSGRLNGELKVDSELQYDVIGNLRKSSVAATGDENDPFQDYTTYSYDIRGQLFKQLSKSFKFGLRRDVKGRITEQVWKNELLDQSDSHHLYQYDYDPLGKIVNANYSEASQTSWYSGYDTEAHLTPPTIVCEPIVLNEIEDAIKDLEDLIDDSVINGIEVSVKTRDALYDALDFIGAQLVERGEEFASLSPKDQEAFLSELFVTAEKQNVQLGELDKLYNDLEAILNKTKEGATKENTKATKDQVKVDKTYTQMLLEKISIVTIQKCVINGDALAYSSEGLSTWQAGDITQSPKYDCSYWYSKTGNIDLLHRNDDVGIQNKQLYSYGSDNNKLQSVEWIHNGVTEQTTPYFYDDNGNITLDMRSEITEISYSSYRNLPVTIQKSNNEEEHFRYGVGGKRNVKIHDNGEKEFYVGGVILDSTGEVKRCNISQGYVIFDENYTELRHYSITDWLGTTRAVLTESGAITAARDHYPYGKLMPQRSQSESSEDRRFQFTGHEHDGFSQYEYHGARYYSAELAKYMSVDPLASLFSSWSGYNYVMGNPIMLIDPFGLSPVNPEGDEKSKKKEKKEEPIYGATLNEASVVAEAPHWLIDPWDRAANRRTRFQYTQEDLAYRAWAKENNPSIFSAIQRLENQGIYHHWGNGSINSRGYENAFEKGYTNWDESNPGRILSDVTGQAMTISVAATAGAPYLARASLNYYKTVGLKGVANLGVNYASQSLATGSWSFKGKSITGLIISGSGIVANSVTIQAASGISDAWLNVSIDDNGSYFVGGHLGKKKQYSLEQALYLTAYNLIGGVAGRLGPGLLSRAEIFAFNEGTTTLGGYLMNNEY